MDSIKQNPNIKLVIGSDHAGYDLKVQVIDHLKSKGVTVDDYGTYSKESVDYPDIGAKVARAVAAGDYSGGILICGSGIGMSIVANKIDGIRAALCTSQYLAEFSRRHNNANILCIGGRILTKEEAAQILDTWLETPFEGGRHQNRVNKIHSLTKK